MKLVIAVACLIVVASASFQRKVDIMAHYKEQFNLFKAKYNRKYVSRKEELKRFGIFTANMGKAAKLQESNPLAQFGVNDFADMDEYEFSRYHNGAAHFAKIDKTVTPTTEKLASSAGQKIDWRTKDAVTPVKNQGQCGSCWAFSTTGNIEGQHAIKHKQLVSISEQELVSCDTTDDGCNGGLMDNAFAWLIKNKAGEIDTEASYPYVSGNGVAPACKPSGHTVGAKIVSYKNIAHNENAIADQVYAGGPVSIAVDATSWQTYNGGIMTNCISQQVDHGVLAVGFDDTNSPPYWIIKNSWAASWGENGYIRVAKGSNQCLIDTYPCTSESA